jgi:hypothetical protein
VDDVYDVTVNDDFSNRLIETFATDDGSEPVLTPFPAKNAGIQFESTDGRLVEQVVQPGKVYKIAVAITIAYAGNQRHYGSAVFSRIKVDMSKRSIAPTIDAAKSLHLG